MTESTIAPPAEDVAKNTTVLGESPGCDGATARTAALPALGEEGCGEDGAVAVEDYDRILWVSPSSLRIGPNVRQENAEPDPEQVRAFKNHGVQEPIKAYRRGDELIVVVGQLRTLGAVRAGVERVPVWLVAPPAADERTATIERIVTQFSENRHRKQMTRGDEFRTYQQLQLAGMSPTAIGRKLSVGKPEVVASLAVGTSELAATAADSYDLTLDQAAVVAEFEGYGDLKTAEELIVTAVERPNNFAALAQRRRNDRAEAQRRRAAEAAVAEQLTAAGIAILDDSISDWTGPARSLDRLRPTPDHKPGTDLTVTDHATCPGHSAWIDYEYDESDTAVAVAVYGCSDYLAHGHAVLHAPAGHADYPASGAHATTISVAPDADADEIAAAAELARHRASIERRWVRNNNKDADAALPHRHEWLAGFAHRASLPKGSRRWLALRTLDGDPTMHQAMHSGHLLAHRLLGVPAPTRPWNTGTGSSSDLGELHERITNASDAKATVYELYLVLCAMEEAFRRDSWRTPSPLNQLYLTMAIELGYPAPDIDLTVLHPDNIDEIIAAELGTDSTHQDPLADPAAAGTGDDGVDLDAAA